jgi:5,10-methylenetetrahydromethanopterin reductase
MRFSLRLNNDLPVSTYIALAQAAEEAGFNQIWVSNDLFLRSAPVILTAMAAATTRIEIGAGILNPYTIHPGEIAMLAATLDEVSGCRFNLGLAAGAADFLQWVGIAQTHPLAAMRETITAIRALLAGERAAIEGKFLHWSDEAYLRFAAPRVTPIYLGAMGPGMLRLAGEMADGVLPLLFPPEHYFGVLPYINEGVASREQGRGELDFAVCIWVSLAADRAAARRALAEKIAYYGHALSPLILERLGLTRADFDPVERAIMVERDVDKACGLVDERMLQIGVVGAPEDVVARLEPLVAAGARHLSFGPPLGPDPLAAVKLLGERVLPRLRISDLGGLKSAIRNPQSAIHNPIRGLS